MLSLKISARPTVASPGLASLILALLFPKPAPKKMEVTSPRQPGSLMAVAIESDGARYLLEQLASDIQNPPMGETASEFHLPELEAILGFLPHSPSYVVMNGNQRKALVQYVNFYWLRAIERGDQGRMVAYDQLLDELFFAQTNPSQEP